MSIIPDFSSSRCDSSDAHSAFTCWIASWICSTARLFSSSICSQFASSLLYCAEFFSKRFFCSRSFSIFSLADFSLSCSSEILVLKKSIRWSRCSILLRTDTRELSVWFSLCSVSIISSPNELIRLSCLAISAAKCPNCSPNWSRAVPFSFICVWYFAYSTSE